MPFPATRHTLPYVDTAGGQRSGGDPCLHPQIHRLLRRGQSAQWKVHPYDLTHIQCGHVRNVSEEVAAASISQQKDGDHPRQCPISSRQTAQAVVEKASQAPRVIVSATLQSTTGAGRASVEVGTTTVDAQSILPKPERSTNRDRVLLRSVAETQCCAKEIMRHYLRRHV